LFFLEIVWSCGLQAVSLDYLNYLEPTA